MNPVENEEVVIKAETEELVKDIQRAMWIRLVDESLINRDRELFMKLMEGDNRCE